MGYLIAGALFQTGQTILNALAYRNIIRYAYPENPLSFRTSLGGYAGGVALNSILPAQAGTFTMWGIFRAAVPGSTYVGMVGAGIAQSVLYWVIDALLFVAMIILVNGTFSAALGDDLSDAPVITLIVIGALLLIVVPVLARLFWTRAKRMWQNAKAGGAILGNRRAYLVGVALPELGAYACRLGLNAAFMAAFGIPVTVESMLLLLAATEISGTFTVTPGGAGELQALSVAALRNVAPAATVTAMSVSQQVLTTAWNIGFGLVALVAAFGVRGTKELVHNAREESRRRKAEKKAQPKVPAREKARDLAGEVRSATRDQVDADRRAVDHLIRPHRPAEAAFADGEAASGDAVASDPPDGPDAP